MTIWCRCLLILTFALCSCDGVPLPLRTDAQPVSLNVGGDRYVIPANYLDSGHRDKDRSKGADGAFVMVSWPEMGGRPKDGKAYKHYAESNIRILIGPARTYERSLRGIAAMHKARTTRPMVGGMEGFTPPQFVERVYGFEHWVRHHTPRETFGEYDFAHTDIYVRYNGDRRMEAFMRCDGEPAPKGMKSQCKLRVAYAEFPGTTFEISFDRSEALHDVQKIERAVRAKFAEFKAAGAKAQAEGTFE